MLKQLIQKTSFVSITIISVVLITNFSEHSAYALSAQQKRQENQCIFSNEIAQVSPLRGCWRLTFRSPEGVVHQSTLVMDGYVGTMRTSYWSIPNRRTQVVDQRMKLGSSPHGIMIFGYDPVWAGTNRRVSDYSPDNFLFSIQPNGRFVATSCDDRGACSPVEIGSCY